MQKTPRHSAMLSTFIKLPFVIKIFVLSIFSGRFTQLLQYVYSQHISSIKILITENNINGRYPQYGTYNPI